jgi:transposase InsO family protein
LSKDLSAKGPLQALKMALKANANTGNLTHHSDRGVQYCCDAYVQLLENSKIMISMTENGDPLENAIAERVNGILKQELLEEVFTDFAKAQKGVAIACSTYNHLRPHGSIDNLKPAQAHMQSGEITKRWKNYYQINKVKKEVNMV